MSDLHHMELLECADGTVSWRISDDDGGMEILSAGHKNKQQALHHLFGIFLGTWDDSFLAMYEQWQSYAGEDYPLPEGAEAGPPVRIEDAMPEAFAGPAQPGDSASATTFHGDPVKDDVR